MGGKTILILILGFSMVFLFKEKNLESASINSVQNYSDYYSKTVAHNTAVSGANIIVNQFFLNPAQPTGNRSIGIDNGTANINVTLTNPVLNTILISSTGTFGRFTSIVQVTLQMSYFSKFAYCSNDENGIWWTTNDTVNGPFHTQDYLNVYGHPVFNPGPTSSVSTLKGINKYNRSSSPIINGVFRQGDNLQIPSTGVSTLESKANSGGYVFTNHDTVYLTFATDSLRYKFSYKGTQTTVKTSNFAPNGTIVADNAILRIQGVVKGQLTVGVSGSGSKGTVYIDNDVVYHTNPRVDSTNADLLGLVAQNNVYIADNGANNSDININAAIYAQQGGFGAQNYSTRPYSGTIYLLGGITQNSRLAVGVIGRYGNITNGFNKNYTYDNRLLVNVPPSFPSTGSYTVLSWYE